MKREVDYQWRFAELIALRDDLTDVLTPVEAPHFSPPSS